MKNFKKFDETISYLQKYYDDSGSPLIFVDGNTYYEGCGVGGIFHYNNEECLEINRVILDPSKKKSDWDTFIESFKGEYSIISRNELTGYSDGKNYPLKKVF